MPRHILIKLKKTKHRERILKSGKGKVTYKQNPILLQLIFQQKLSRPEGNGKIYLKYWKGKIYNQDYGTQQLMEKSKAFQTSKSLENSVPPNQLFNKC